MKDKLFVFQKTMLLLVLMLVGATQARAQENYDLLIAGVYVTSENCNDLSVIPGVSGTVKYVPEAKTLYLENATITGGDAYGISNSLTNLTINVTGENKITSNWEAIYLNRNVTIKGGGILNAESSDGFGILGGDLLEIDSCTVNAKGSSGFGGVFPHSQLLIKKNATVTAEGSERSIGFINYLILDGCHISEPAGAEFDASQKAVVLNGEVVKSKIVIEKDAPIIYGLQIKGVDVTSENCNDLSVIDGVSGTVKYAPETKTLFLENATIAAGKDNVGIENYYWKDSLTINVTGENKITSNMDAISLYNNVTIKGGGILNAESSDGFGILGGDLLEIDSCTVNAKGSYGLAGPGHCELVIKSNAIVTAEGTIMSLSGFVHLILDGPTITQPQGATYVPTEGVWLNGKIVTDKVVIEKKVVNYYGLWLAGVEVTSENCNDLSVIDGVSGTVKFEPKTKTLFLEDATIAADEIEKGGIYNEWIDSLTINVTGENKITSIHTAMALRQFVTIKGEGTLNAESNYSSGISFLDTLEIDSCTVNTKGIWGISGFNGTSKKLTIRYANVTAEGSEGSICDIASLTLDDSKISTPEGAAFDASQKAVALNGQIVKGEVVIKKDVPINYGLQIAGVDVTSENYNDLSGISGVSGTVRYAPETKTLYLDNATITGEDAIGIKNDSINKLTINVTGENKITSNADAIVFNKQGTIKGGGTLNAESSDGAGLRCDNEVYIDSCTVNVKGKYGIIGEVLWVSYLRIKSNAIVTAEGSQGSIFLEALALDGTVIAQPGGAMHDVDKDAVVLGGNIVTDKVVIEKGVKYDLWLAGVNVTDKNCNDLSVIPEVSGTVKYDPETKTLFLEDATIAAAGRGLRGIYNLISGLTINVTGENKVTASGGTTAITLTRPTIIKGGGTLNAESSTNCGIYIDYSLDIEYCTVNAKGPWGIAGNYGNRETITISNADVTAEGSEGSICDIASLTLDDSKISTPEGAAFDASQKAVALNGQIVKGKVVIISDRTVGIKDVKASVPAHKQGIYSIDGVYLGTDFDALPKGIYIKDGKKVKK